MTSLASTIGLKDPTGTTDYEGLFDPANPCKRGRLDFVTLSATSERVR